MVLASSGRTVIINRYRTDPTHHRPYDDEYRERRGEPTVLRGRNHGNAPKPPRGTSPTYVRYDGLTTVMTALAQDDAWRPCHIKIVVGDANDTVRDSAVFLEAGSFPNGGISMRW
ncbi:MAG: choice-of-anchor L domain-containing protein [Flavobacteriales bacterium]|nr:choice-of-anchor L domain-containing protein [Flavobacteriales bacterium]